MNLMKLIDLVALQSLVKPDDFSSRRRERILCAFGWHRWKYYTACEYAQATVHRCCRRGCGTTRTVGRLEDGPCE